MKANGSELLLSATDLASHLGCRHLTSLNRLRAEGKLRPPTWENPQADVLALRGEAHEAAYLDYLRAEEGRDVEDLGTEPKARLDPAGIARTKDAMSRGIAAIAQAPLVQGRWRGYADVLLRVEQPSDLGAWSYIAADTKLAVETKGGTILQLCLYSDILASYQERIPGEMRVVAPGHYATPECFRTSDFLAYYRLVRRQLEDALARADGDAATYPDPVDQCSVCKWWPTCDKRWRADDHLSFVAGINRLQRAELVGRDMGTLTALAQAEAPLDPRPERGSPESYEKVHHQARIQLESRDEGRPRVEFLEGVEPGQGLARLPEPSPGDVFFDYEGDPFVEGGGLEYLTGWVTVEDGTTTTYRGEWALSHAAEKAAFEHLIDELTERWERYPDFHVYHFAPYEPATLKRLMGRHATREEELDRLLRGERFVDLHSVVKQSLRIGVETYGLKQLEAVHGFERQLDLRDVSLPKNALERALELGDPGAIDDDDREKVRQYNEDDCVSTWRLRDWLETKRAERIEAGVDIPRPALSEGDASEALDERTERIRALFEELTRDVPFEPSERTPEQHSRWTLGHLLEWHRREDKAAWWEYFRLSDCSAEELLDEKPGLAGLEFVAEVEGGTAKCPIHRYRFAEQDHDVRAGQTLHVDQDTQCGGVEEIDLAARTVDIKKRSDAASLHPEAVFAHDKVPQGALPGALERIATWTAENGVDAPGPYRAARDLLLGQHPRLATTPAGPLARPGEADRDAATRLALDLDESVLPIQGPPGTGKTYTGARVICALVAAGKKVGITAVSHKVIRNLIDEVLKAATEESLDIGCVQKVREASEDCDERLLEVTDNKKLDAAFARDDVQVAGGTVWAWARELVHDTLDYLVIDEAGQMSLANAVAAAQAARNVVLLGDPQQLEQPMQGSHPEGCEASVLEHLLQGHDTIPVDRGLFLPTTWRLHPKICAFTSELFYEGRLEAKPGCEQQAIVGSSALDGAGLWMLPVEHEGNQTSSPEEVEAVAGLVEGLVREGAGWIDPDGNEKQLAMEDILIVSPYNAQVAALRARLPEFRVGTVDKFQGQEAPVVVYSMATSAAAEAPRGMEFLFSLNRLNVATSRARCACVVVASEGLFEVECRTPGQMRLANGLCRYAEMSKSLGPAS